MNYKMKYIKTLPFLSLLFSLNAFALDSHYQLSARDTIDDIKKKFKGDVEITKSKDHLSLFFSKPQEFNPTERDVFEVVETDTKSSDRLLQKLVIADPSGGRIFHLNTNMKVTTLDLMEPWSPKTPLKPIPEIMKELRNPKLEKAGKKK